MPAEPEGGGGFMTQKFMGIPAIVWLLGAAAVAYFLFSRNSASSGSGSSSAGSSDTLTTGDTSVATGAVQVTVNAGGSGDTGGGGGNTQPSPPTTGTTTTTTNSGTVEIPNVVGMKGSAAEALLKARGFRTTQNPKTTPKGKTTKVTRQSPTPGQAKKGSTVNLDLSVNK